MNLILSASHGGTIDTFSPSIPDRDHGCYVNGACVFEHNCAGGPDPVNCKVSTVRDFKTDVIATLLREEIHTLTQEYPKIVVNNIHRSKLDPNRAEQEGTFGQSLPQTVYNWYHGNISLGIAGFGGSPGLLIDVHGYNDDVTTEALLGYRISGYRLNTYSESQLNSKWNDSSIRHLAAASSESFTNLLRGSSSLGAAMDNETLSSVPSPSLPGPGSGKYYSGGYITQLYGLETDAIQIEIHRDNRTPKTSREAYAEKLARAIVNFYQQHY